MVSSPGRQSELAQICTRIHAHMLMRAHVCIFKCTHAQTHKSPAIKVLVYFPSCSAPAGVEAGGGVADANATLTQTCRGCAPGVRVQHNFWSARSETLARTPYLQGPSFMDLVMEYMCVHPKFAFCECRLQLMRG